ncbi:MAG TPA: hypothetical protein DCO77_01310 [Nitrospiraceae bacterium]|nr:hypothetical protein [Nitrospiraceae bacterium]
MKKSAFIILAAMVLGACTAGYKVKVVEDQFSDPNKAYITKTMDGNFISSTADPLKLVPASELNAYVMVNKQTNKADRVGLHLYNVRRNGNKWLNIREGDEMIILADNNRVVLRARNAKMDHHVSSNSVTRTIDTDYFDSAFYSIEKEDFKKIAYATSIKIKINGMSGIEEYTKQINGGLLPNFKRFYEEEVEMKPKAKE